MPHTSGPCYKARPWRLKQCHIQILGLHKQWLVITPYLLSTSESKSYLWLAWHGRALQDYMFTQCIRWTMFVWKHTESGSLPAWHPMRTQDYGCLTPWWMETSPTFQIYPVRRCIKGTLGKRILRCLLKVIQTSILHHQQLINLEKYYKMANCYKKYNEIK